MICLFERSKAKLGHLPCICITKCWNYVGIVVIVHIITWQSTLYKIPNDCFKAKKHPKKAVIYRIFQVFYLVKSADLLVFLALCFLERGKLQKIGLKVFIQPQQIFQVVDPFLDGRIRFVLQYGYLPFVQAHQI